MKVTEMKSSPEKPNPHNVSVRMLYDTEHAQAVHIELKPGEALKKHVTPTDVFFYILEGKGVVEIGDETSGSQQGYADRKSCKGPSPPSESRRWGLQGACC